MPNTTHGRAKQAGIGAGPKAWATIQSLDVMHRRLVTITLRRRVDQGGHQRRDEG
ncbi:hypothetical protein [Mesorhizobium sp. 43Arga]